MTDFSQNLVVISCISEHIYEQEVVLEIFTPLQKEFIPALDAQDESGEVAIQIRMDLGWDWRQVTEQAKNLDNSFLHDWFDWVDELPVHEFR